MGWVVSRFKTITSIKIFFWDKNLRKKDLWAMFCWFRYQFYIFFFSVKNIIAILNWNFKNQSSKTKKHELARTSIVYTQLKWKLKTDVMCVVLYNIVMSELKHIHGIALLCWIVIYIKLPESFLAEQTTVCHEALGGYQPLRRPLPST